MSHAKLGNLTVLQDAFKKERTAAIKRGRVRLLDLGDFGASEAQANLRESLDSHPLPSDSPLKVASQVYLDNIGTTNQKDGSVYVGPKDERIGSVSVERTGLTLEFGSSRIEPHPHYDKAARAVFAKAKKEAKSD